MLRVSRAASDTDRSRSGERGGAMLNAVMVLAAVSALIAAQLRGLEHESLENNLSARSVKAQRFGTSAIGLTKDLLARQHLTVECGSSKKMRVAISEDAPKTVRKRLARMFNQGKQQLTYSFCDQDRFNEKDLARLYVTGGREPKGCEKATSEVKFETERMTCGKDTVYVTTSTSLPTSPIPGDKGRTALVQKAMLASPEQKAPGCPFSCHMASDPPKWVREDKKE